MGVGGYLILGPFSRDYGTIKSDAVLCVKSCFSFVSYDGQGERSYTPDIKIIVPHN